MERATLQRLFTTFPIGWPAAGLLLLRLAAGVALIIRGLSATHGILQPAPLILSAAAVVSGVFLLLGLWTPFIGLSAVFVELLNAIPRTGDEGCHLLLAAMALSLVMLGPGAWSIDAYKYGRRRIDF